MILKIYYEVFQLCICEYNRWNYDVQFYSDFRYQHQQTTYVYLHGLSLSCICTIHDDQSSVASW